MFIKVMEIQKFFLMIEMFLLLACIVPLIILQKSKSDIDIELQDNMEDEEYLNILNQNRKIKSKHF